MKRSILFVFCALMCVMNVNAVTKLFVWAPKPLENLSILSSYNDTIILKVSDKREFQKKVKIHFTSEELTALVDSTIRVSLPNAVFINELNDTTKHYTTISVDIDSYVVGAGVNIAEWLTITPLSQRLNAICAYSLEITRPDGKNVAMKISKSDKKRNTKGYSQAKWVLNKEYQEATSELLENIHSSL